MRYHPITSIIRILHSHDIFFASQVPSSLGSDQRKGTIRRGRRIRRSPGQCVRALRIGASEDLLAAQGHEDLSRPGEAEIHRRSVTSPAGSVETHGNPMEPPWKPHGKRIKLNDSVIMTYLWYHIDIGNPIIGIYESLVMRIKNRHIIIYWPLGDIDLKPPLNEWRLARYEDDREFSATIEIWLGISSLCCFATHPAVLMMP